jgi:two-component sensor histidine kinase
VKSKLPLIKERIKQLFIVAALFLCFTDIKAQGTREIVVITKRLFRSKDDTNKVDNLISLGYEYADKKIIQTKDFDSIILLKNQAATLSKKLSYIKGVGQCMMLDAQIAFKKNDKQRASKIVDSAIAYFEKSGLVSEQADAYLRLAFITGNDREDVSNKIFYLKNSISLYKQINANKEIGICLQEMADVKHLYDQPDTSILLLNQALKAYQAAGYRNLQRLYSLYCINYINKSDFTIALKYGLLAAKTAEEVGDSTEQLSEIYSHIGQVYNYSGNLEQATDWLEKARNISLSLQDTLGVIHLNTQIAETLIMSNRLQDAINLLSETEKHFPPTVLEKKVRLNQLFSRAYIYNNQVDKATRYFNRMVELYDSVPKGSFLTDELSLGIIEYLHETRQFKKAYPYMEAYRSASVKANNLMQLINVEGMYFTADSATGNFEGALNHYKLYRAYSDSMYGIEKIKQMNDLQVQHETDKKDKNIQLLTQKNQFQSTVIQKEQSIKKMTIGALILLVLVLGLGYNRFLLKKRSNVRLQLQQGQINQQNEELKKLLSEKEWLLREIHHRVKNNLQIVISLLNTQSAYLNNQEALEAIQNSQHRMNAMSLIHQKLYQSDNMAHIDMNWYIRELTGYIKDCFDIDGRVVFIIDADSILLDVAQAIPLSLILNESITNAIKYAFPNREKGEIKVMLKLIDKDTCQLVVADNGIGLPAHLDISESSSLGMSLMYGLSEQLGGELQLVSDKGTKFSIQFKLSTTLSVKQVEA